MTALPGGRTFVPWNQLASPPPPPPPRLRSNSVPADELLRSSNRPRRFSPVPVISSAAAQCWHLTRQTEASRPSAFAAVPRPNGGAFAPGLRSLSRFPDMSSPRMFSPPTAAAGGLAREASRSSLPSFVSQPPAWLPRPAAQRPAASTLMPPPRPLARVGVIPPPLPRHPSSTSLNSKLVPLAPAAALPLADESCMSRTPPLIYHHRHAPPPPPPRAFALTTPCACPLSCACLCPSQAA